MKVTEQAVVFSCAGERLLSIIAKPEQTRSTGILVVVGGPQYRVGSHRQFLLLSRALATAGYPVMRFDFRGMGDSTGQLRNFEAVGQDIASAINVFIASLPGVERIVLWGLCDAASAALLYWDATRDQRIGGLVLLNPWVRSEATLARAHIKYYYAQRLLKAEFWHKLLSGQLGISQAVNCLLTNLRQSRQDEVSRNAKEQLSFRERMLRGLEEFQRPVLLILSGNDYTAKEFIEKTKASPAWQAALSGQNVVIRDVDEADHTFASNGWRREVEETTLAWLQRLEC